MVPSQSMLLCSHAPCDRSGQLMERLDRVQPARFSQVSFEEPQLDVDARFGTGPAFGSDALVNERRDASLQFLPGLAIDHRAFMWP